MNRRLAFFYHVWCPPQPSPIRLIVDEQLKRLQRSGIQNAASVHCTVSGRARKEIAAYILSYNWITSVTEIEDESKFEGETLVRLHDYCCSDAEVHAVAYAHTKGVRLLNDDTDLRVFKAVNSWRHFMEWGVIDRWRDALILLQKYDAVGVNFRSDPWPHFGGNFWWSRASYVRSLVRPIMGCFPTNNGKIAEQDARDGRGRNDRLYFERWIGTNDPEVFSFYGYPFKDRGMPLPPDFHNLYEADIEPFYRENGV